MHYNRRQNKGLGGVSQIKNLIRIPLRKKKGLCACIWGREICDSENKNGNGLLQLGLEVCTLEK